MDNNLEFQNFEKGLTFKPHKKVGFVNVSGGVLFIFSSFLILYISIDQSGLLSTFGLLFGFATFLIGIYSIIFFYRTRLKISKIGLWYSQPFFQVFCKWEQILEIQFPKGEIIVYFNTAANVQTNIIGKILAGKNYIPLQIFTWKHDKYKYWKTDPVLLELQKYIPGLDVTAKELYG
jgi:hypothetical protein